MTIIFFFQAEDGIRDADVTGVQTCALPISEDRDHTDRAGDRNDHDQRGDQQRGPVLGDALAQGRWRRSRHGMRGDPGGAGPGRPVRIGCGPGGVGTRRLGGVGAILVVRLPGRRSGRGGTVDRQLRAIPLKTVGREADRTGATMSERHRTGRPYLSRPASLSPRPGENGAATPTRPRVPPYAPPAPTWHPTGSAARHTAPPARPEGTGRRPRRSPCRSPADAGPTSPAPWPRSPWSPP